MGTVITGHRPGLRARSRRVHQDLEQRSGRPRRRRVRAPSQSLERPRSIVGIVDVGSQIAGNVWGMLALLGLDQLLARPDQPDPAAAVRRWARRGRHLRGDRVEDPADRKVQVDYRKLMPVTTVFMVLFLAFGLSTMLLDVRDAIGGS